MGYLYTEHQTDGNLRGWIKILAHQKRHIRHEKHMFNILFTTRFHIMNHVHNSIMFISCSYHVHMSPLSYHHHSAKSGASFHPLCTYNPQMSEFSRVEGRPSSRREEGTAITTQRWPNKSETTAGASFQMENLWKIDWKTGESICVHMYSMYS